MSDELYPNLRQPDAHPHVPNVTTSSGPSSFAAPTGLAARVVVSQALVNEIVWRARASSYGLGEAEVKPNIDNWEPKNLEALAHCLVSSWTAKYDLVSVFSAAMSVIQEKTANVRMSEGGRET